MQNTVYSGDGPNISILVVLDQKMLKIQKPIIKTDVDKVVECCMSGDMKVGNI